MPIRDLKTLMFLMLVSVGLFGWPSVPGQVGSLQAPADCCLAQSCRQADCGACEALEKAGQALAPGSAARAAFLQEWRAGRFCSPSRSLSPRGTGCCCDEWLAPSRL